MYRCKKAPHGNNRYHNFISFFSISCGKFFYTDRGKSKLILLLYMESSGR